MGAFFIGVGRPSPFLPNAALSKDIIGWPVTATGFAPFTTRRQSRLTGLVLAKDAGPAFRKAADV